MRDLNKFTPARPGGSLYDTRYRCAPANEIIPYQDNRDRRKPNGFLNHERRNCGCTNHLISLYPPRVYGPYHEQDLAHTLT